MFFNYFASALRNLIRNRLYAGITIAGLAVGFAAAIFSGLFVRDEFGYDRFIPNYPHIYRVAAGHSVPREKGEWSGIISPEIARLLQSAPQVDAVARLSPDGAGFRRGTTYLGNEMVMWADANFFDIVALPVVAGDLRTALQQPDGMVITRAAARQYFGKDDPIGEVIGINPERHPMRVTAVIEDLPSNTHLVGRVFLPGHAPFSPLARADANNGAAAVTMWNAMTYVRVRSTAAATQLQRAFPDLLKRHTGEPDSLRLRLTPIADIHLANERGMSTSGDLAVIRAVAAIGTLILLAAIINFVNLMTARAARRAAEVAVRKTFGASRSDLIVQFIGESTVYVAMSVVLGVALVELLLKTFNTFLDRTIAFAYWSDPTLLVGILALVLLVGVLAGIYPAVVLSSFRPALALQEARGAAKAAFVRQALVIAQFAILIGLVIAAAVIYRQTAFSVARSLRQLQDEVLLVQGACGGRMEDQVRALPGVRSAVCSDGLPVGFNLGVGVPARDGKMMEVASTSVGADYFKFFGVALRAGRYFSEDRPGDRSPDNLATDINAREVVILNETAVRALQYPSAQAAIGQSFTWSRIDRATNDGRVTMSTTAPHTAEIVGVVEDFTVGSVRDAVPPAVFYVDPGQFSRLNVKLVGDKIPETVAAIEQLWKEFGGPKSYYGIFWRQSIEELYRDLKRQMTMIAIFAGIALLIGCLGLFGLAAFTAERRTKEIGVRKALGADTHDVMRLLAWQFMKPVVWANLLAWPAVAWLMQRWLNGFAYHVDLEPWIFATAAVGAAFIALVTVSGHCYLAASAKPVKALKYE